MQSVYVAMRSGEPGSRAKHALPSTKVSLNG
jgi:hypothetical protein